MSTLRERIEDAYDHFREQLKQTSTIRSAVVFLGSLSVINMDHADKLIPWVLMASALLGLLLPDDINWDWLSKLWRKLTCRRDS